MTTNRQTFRDHLRSIPSLVGTPLDFDVDVRPATPQEMFLQWFRSAEEAGIPEPHAMSVSTVDVDGVPDSRMLVLKDLSAEGAWCFAGRRDSTKGLELTAHSVAAILFYWREQLRSVRVRGNIIEGTAAEARADFVARHPEARAVALSGRQGSSVPRGTDIPRDVEAAAQRLVDDPDLVPDEWAMWKLEPIEVEFWQGSKSRLHTRLRYERDLSGWRTSELRP